jgi:hypothetical protein
MPGENLSNDQPSRAEEESRPQSSVAPTDPAQDALTYNPEEQSTRDNSTARELAREFRWVESAQLIISGVLAIVGLIALWVYYGQLRVMRGQLGEIAKQYPELKRSADAAKVAADTAANQLELSERPWIKIVDVKTLGDNPIIPALSFQRIGPFKDISQQATFQLIVSLKNIGHSVADVAVRFELFFPLWDSGGYWNVISAEQKRFCDSLAGRGTPEFYPKFVVFPDESFDWHGAAVGLTSPSVTNHLANHPGTGYLLPVLMICANYRLRTLDHNYQTRTIYEAFHAEDRTRFFTIGEGVPAKRILLMRNEMADDAY